jgi:hypothetical protein
MIDASFVEALGAAAAGEDAFVGMVISGWKTWRLLASASSLVRAR